MKNQTGQKLHIRKVTEADAELLFSWANDIDVRRNAFTQREIVWDEHVQWLKKKLADENCLMYIAYLYMTDMSEKPVGQIRLDIEKGRAEIDYSIIPLLRGQGYGTVRRHPSATFTQFLLCERNSKFVVYCIEKA